ncbi:MAG TPA: branched-chain amino acid ABC transporter permease [Calditerricola sp.]
MHVINGLMYAAFLFLISAGLTLIFGVMRIVNFAHGALAMVGGYVAFAAATALGSQLVAGVVAATLVMGILGIVLERIFLTRLYGRDELYQILFTYGLVLVAEDVVKILWGRGYKSLGPPLALAKPVHLGGIIVPAYNLALIAVAVLLAIALWLMLQRTRYGAAIRAVSANREVAAALGINVARLGAAVFGIGTGMAALGSSLFLPVLTVSPNYGVQVVVEAFIVVVLGGLGSIWGAAIGSVLIGISRAFGIALIPSFEQALIYLVMALVLIVRPWGLLGTAPLERN